MIPKIIHQIWIGPKDPPLEYMDTWRRLHPSWNYQLWNNERVFSRSWRNQRLVNYYRQNQTWHGVADVIRYEILFEIGGFMPGADSECLLPVDDLFEKQFDAFAVYENETVRPGLITPLYACKPGAEFAKALIYGLGAIPLPPGIPWKTTGNLFMQKIFEEHPWPTVKIFPSHYFNPVHHTGLEYKGPGKIYARQHWMTTKAKKGI